jgi:hypothetical protein
MSAVRYSMGTVMALGRQIVSRLSTPERIDGCRREATRNRLIGDDATEPTAAASSALTSPRMRVDRRSTAYWDRAAA